MASQISNTPPPNKLPVRYLEFQKRFPKVFRAFNALGAAIKEAGPLEDKTCAFVKLALAIGARSEGAVHSHTRRALEAGCTPEELCHVVLLATTTLGFPSMMATLSWVEDVLKQNKQPKSAKQ
jgi:4-carboxymuconolactone decarboxylase